MKAKEVLQLAILELLHSVSLQVLLLVLHFVLLVLLLVLLLVHLRAVVQRQQQRRCRCVCVLLRNLTSDPLDDLGLTAGQPAVSVFVCVSPGY